LFISDKHHHLTAREVFIYDPFFSRPLFLVWR